MTSGVIHLILDHAPVFLPVLGGARSRQMSNSSNSGRIDRRLMLTRPVWWLPIPPWRSHGHLSHQLVRVCFTHPFAGCCSVVPQLQLYQLPVVLLRVICQTCEVWTPIGPTFTWPTFFLGVGTGHLATLQTVLFGKHMAMSCSDMRQHATTCDNMRLGLDLVRFGAICSRQHIAGHTFRLKSSRGGKRLCRICWS